MCNFLQKLTLYCKKENEIVKKFHLRKEIKRLQAINKIKKHKRSILYDDLLSVPV